MLVRSFFAHGCVPKGASSMGVHEYNLHVDKSDLGIVIFHPYTLLGGSCDDPVVLALFRQAMRTEAVQIVVRYNQRGVGTSSGSKSVWGASDLTDAIAVCQHILSLQNGPKHLHLVGYSWGACLAAHAAAQLKDVTAFVGVSPVTGAASFFLRSKRHFAELCTRPDLPKLLVLGEHDQFSSLTSLKKVFEPHRQKAGLQDTPNRELDYTVIETMANCDHFFANQCSELAKRVLSFCERAHEGANRTISRTAY